MAYLDHWGLMKFSDETALGSRLASALKKTEGTLTVSWLNFSEFATVTHRDQRLRAERLLDSVAPALFCLNSEPFQVHARQLRGDVMPHADEELAALFVSTQRTLTATGLFEPLNHPRLVKGKKTLARTIQERLEKLRQEWADNTSFRSEVARADRSPEARAATRTLAIARTLVATFFPDLRRPITENDAIDFLHGVCPKLPVIEPVFALRGILGPRSFPIGVELGAPREPAHALDALQFSSPPGHDVRANECRLLALIRIHDRLDGI